MNIWHRILCFFGAHDWKNDGVLRYWRTGKFGEHEDRIERLVQRCDRDDCWQTRFL